MHRFSPIPLVATVLLALSLTACGLFDDDTGGEAPGVEQEPVKGVLEVEADGVTMRIIDAEYASTGTRLYIEIERPEDAPFARVGYYYRPPFDPEVHLEGFAPVERLDITTSGGAASEVDRIEYQLGEVVDPEVPLVFEVQRLCPVEQPGQGCIDGPWRFEWTPGAEAADTVDVTIPVGETHSDGIITVHIEDVRLSSTEIVVTTWSEGSADGGRPYPSLKLRLPDGTEVLGEGGGGSSEEPPRTLKTWRFPVLPDGVREFAIEVEPYLQSETHTAAFEFSLAGRLDGVNPDADSFTEVPIGAAIEIDGETLRLSHVQIGHGYYNFVVQNVTEGEPTIHFGGSGLPAFLRDGQGNTQSPDGGGGNSRAETSFRFRSLDTLELDSLQLATNSISRLMPGPAPFFVTLP